MKHAGGGRVAPRHKGKIRQIHANGAKSVNVRMISRGERYLLPFLVLNSKCRIILNLVLT